MVLCIDLAACTVTTEQFHVSGRRLAASTEKFGWLEFPQTVFTVVLAVLTVLPADRPVLFIILNNRFVSFKHGKNGMR